MYRFLCMAVIGLAVLALPLTASANTIPAKDSTSPYPISLQLGFSDGDLYLFTGDALYDVDLTDRNNPTFSIIASGFESVLSPTRYFEASFATAPGGKAAISYGASSGGMILVDIATARTSGAAAASTAVTDFDATNVFSLAGRQDGSFYAMSVASDWSTSTQLHHVSVTGDTADVIDPAAGTGYASGGLATDANDNLFASAFDWSAYADVTGDSHFYKLLDADLDAFEADNNATPPFAVLGSGVTNGNGSIVVGDDGNIYFNTTTGIGAFDVDSGTVTNLLGDITDASLYSYGNTQPYNGLAFDPTANELIFAEYDSNTGSYALGFYAIPEPTTALCLTFSMAVMLVRRGRK